MDFSKCLTTTISWVLAILSYDEDHAVDNVRQLFPSFKVHFWISKRGSHAHGVALDDDEGRAWHFHRGTDGFSTLGKAISWFNNACMVAGRDGTHNGFDRLAHRAFDDCKLYLENYDYLYESGHSQGAGVAPLDACLCVENLTLKHVQCDLFATPPCVKKAGKRRIDNHINNGIVSGNRYVMPGDPISSNKLRNENSILLNGEDVFEEVLLPDLLIHEVGFLEVINHSGRFYNAGYMQHLINWTNALPEPDLKLLAKINDWIVN